MGKNRFWHDERFQRISGQAIVVFILLVVIIVLGYNFNYNFQKLGLKFGFDFLDRPASFAIGDTIIPYRPNDPYFYALLAGLVNTLRVMIIGIFLATILGVSVGLGRLSNNWLVQKITTIYVEIIRNTPLLLQLFFWYFAVFLKFPKVENPLIIFNSIYLSNQGLNIPWFIFNYQSLFALLFLVISIIAFRILWVKRTEGIIKEGYSGTTLERIMMILTISIILMLIFGLDWRTPQLDTSNNLIKGGLYLAPEFSALLLGLTIYTAAFIAEVVRAGIQSVNKGQWEAAKALGLSHSLTIQLVIFPQAMRVIIPPLTSEFLNLAKNTSLAIAVGYNDIYAVANTASNQTGRAVEMLLIIMATYLIINLIISLGMNWLNKLVKFEY